MTAFLWLFCFCSLSNAQPSKISLSKANKYFIHGFYEVALPTYLNELSKRPQDAELNLKAGICLVHCKRKSDAKDYLLKARSNGETESLFYLGQIAHSIHQFDSALYFYSDYKSSLKPNDSKIVLVNDFINKSNSAKEYLLKSSDYLVKNMGEKINSEFNDHVPVITADESMMIFTSRRPTSVGGNLDHTQDYFEDMYVTNHQNNEWSNPENIGGNLNTPHHDACIGLAPDGQKLLLYRMDHSRYGGDIFESQLEGKNWSVPHKLSININSGHHEPSASYSADMNILYFSSSRPGGFGGMDIYMSRKLPDGQWGKATNLGPVINTSYDEDAPYIHPEGHTLFFSSEGHKNMGGYDIFKSILADNGQWSIPANLGSPVNSVEDDIYYVLSASGHHAYFSSDRPQGFGKSDIYKVEIPKEELSLAVIKGKTFNKNSQEVVESVIRVVDLAKGEIHGVFHSNSFTGNYILILPAGKKYSVIVDSENFQPISEEFDFTTLKEFKELIKDFKLEKINTK